MNEQEVEAAAEETTPPSGGKAEEETTPPSGGRTASEFRDTADALRKRVDLFGKTLAAIATLGTTAVGLNKIGDLFPAEGYGWAAVAVACVGLAAAALAAIAVAVRLMKVARPLFLDADLDSNKDLDNDGERNAVRPVFEGAAKRFGYTSLIGLQERERSLRDAASWTTDKDERARRTALADEVKTEIEQALARGQVVAVRRRAVAAVSGWSWLWYIVAIAGVIIFAAGTDWVSSDRKGPADAKACGEARTAGATAGELGRTDGTCDGEAKEATEKPEPPSAAEARAQITAKLAATLEACAVLIQKAGDAKSGPLKDEDCDPLRDAVSAMTGASP